ncbi:unnamed protein product [Heligmosomoides polygyrus]|uniref:Uncharacterized protein n=1 Tax=Heligmosomoides polygyrus TaxID=6339 RepID=A0A3P7YNP0_HELPZ|nr:unnamed protein product [Heligmosomoides polygyrus]
MWTLYIVVRSLVRTTMYNVIIQAERMLAEFDRVCGNVGLQQNLTKTISVYPRHEVNMANDLAPELSRRKRAASGAFKSVEEVAKKTKNVRLRAHLFDFAFFLP